MAKTAVLMYTLTEYLTVKNTSFHFLKGVGAQFLIKCQKSPGSSRLNMLRKWSIQCRIFLLYLWPFGGQRQKYGLISGFLVSLTPISFSFLFSSLHFNILRKIGFISWSAYFYGWTKLCAKLKLCSSYTSVFSVVIFSLFILHSYIHVQCIKSGCRTRTAFLWLSPPPNPHPALTHSEEPHPISPSVGCENLAFHSVLSCII